jgi:hypothetical protein
MYVIKLMVPGARGTGRRVPTCAGRDLTREYRAVVLFLFYMPEAKMALYWMIDGYNA